MWYGGGWEKCLVAPEGFVSLTAPGKKADPCMEDGTLTLCSCVFFLAWAREWLSVPNFPWRLTIKGSHFLGMHPETMPSFLKSELNTNLAASRYPALPLTNCKGLILKIYYFRLLTQDVSIAGWIGEPECSMCYDDYELRGRNRNSISSFSVSGWSVKH